MRRNADAKSGNVHSHLTDILHVRQQEDLRRAYGPGRRSLTEPVGVLVGPRRRRSALQQRTTNCGSAGSTLNGAKGCGARRLWHAAAAAAIGAGAGSVRRRV